MVCVWVVLVVWVVEFLGFVGVLGVDVGWLCCVDVLGV